MNLNEYIEGLQKFLGENPDCAKMQVFTSKDDEGNGYYPVYFTPSKGYYDGEDFELIPEEWDGKPNAVCVN